MRRLKFSTMTSSPQTTRYFVVSLIAGFPFRVFMRIQRLIGWGSSLRPCSSIYLRICSSFSPMVEEKYPTLQMLFSRYISRTNLYFFLISILVRCLIFWTALETAIFGGISIWICIWSSSILKEFMKSVGYSSMVWLNDLTRAGLMYGFNHLRQYFVPHTIWYWCW